MFNRAGINFTSINHFLDSTFLAGQEWDHLAALDMGPDDILEAPYEMILDNPTDDVQTGVGRVQVKLNTLFFGVFDSLIIKHREDGSIQLMFYTETHDAEAVINFYHGLKTDLGGGTLMDHKFSSFNDKEKVSELAAGHFTSSSDELVHSWNFDNFVFTLSYGIDPLRQFLFDARLKARKEPDNSPRTKGTILSILSHNVSEIIASEPEKAIPYLENKAVRFIDYTYTLDPPELGIFEEVKVRIFDEQRKIDENIQTHLTYYSKYEIDTAKTIVLCDRVAGIYGKDNYGDAELIAHELDFLDDSEFWTGRSWLFNTSHAIQDLADDTQSTLYGVTISADPNQDGVSLHILVYNKMQDYQNLMLSGKGN